MVIEALQHLDDFVLILVRLWTKHMLSFDVLYKL